MVQEEDDMGQLRVKMNDLAAGKKVPPSLSVDFQPGFSSLDLTCLAIKKGEERYRLVKDIYPTLASYASCSAFQIFDTRKL